jgi:hypothetical protein
MTWPRTPEETRTIAGSWKPASDPEACAQIWRVMADGQIKRYEADYFQSGRKTDTITGNSFASVVISLQTKYGPARKA